MRDPQQAHAGCEAAPAEGAADDSGDEHEDGDELEDGGSDATPGNSEAGSSEAAPDSEDAASSADSLPLGGGPPWRPDHTFKVLLIGDSGVGKTCLVTRFIRDSFAEHLPSTVGVDYAVKRMSLHGAEVKVTIWDTAGQERFRALTSTFYRGAKGIIFVYDVTRRETLASLAESWMDELARYAPHPDVARMVVANKVDQHERRQVSWAEGAAFAQAQGCLFVETSAAQNIAVGVAFEELVLRILETPSLLVGADEGPAGDALRLGAPPPRGGGYALSCSC
ncbi:YPTV3 [Scenedesmus sp. PABB004]|nr:YPTV3 [Scenedesmus sp. PABB004]